jgi:four helix bundle protein
MLRSLGVPPADMQRHSSQGRRFATRGRDVPFLLSLRDGIRSLLAPLSITQPAQTHLDSLHGARALTVAKELVQRVHEAKIRDAELRDQATRAAKSTFLHLCEGLPHEGVAMRRKYFSGSDASLHETLGAMDLALTIGAANARDARDVQELGVRLHAMLRALLS